LRGSKGLPTTKVTHRSAKRIRLGDCTSVLGSVWRTAARRRRAGSRPAPWLRSTRDIASSQVVAPTLVVFRRVRRQQPAWVPVRGRSYRRSQPSGRVRHNLRPTVADHAKVGQSGRRRRPSEVLCSERRLTTVQIGIEPRSWSRTSGTAKARQPGHRRRQHRPGRLRARPADPDHRPGQRDCRRNRDRL
jgi:hypothetical protein